MQREYGLYSDVATLNDSEWCTSTISIGPNRENTTAVPTAQNKLRDIVLFCIKLESLMQ